MLIPVGVALGSNLDDRLDELRRARSFLESLTQGGWREAQIYESEPVDCPPGSPFFLNTALEIEVDAASSPRALLARLKGYEVGRGRPALPERNAPRSIDLDIIYFGDLILDEPGLKIPHPRATQRRFVLEPLCDIDPARILPGQGSTLRELCSALTGTRIKCRWDLAAH